MSSPITRRSFATLAAGGALAAGVKLANSDSLLAADPAKGEATKGEPAKSEPPKGQPGKDGATTPATGPSEAPFERDYTPPDFKPSWKRPQTNKLLVQDFVIFAHTDLEMVKKLLEKEPSLVLATINWGAGDWESGLGAAAHMGRRDIAEVLLAGGARIDIFCAAMLGMLDVVKAFLTLEPKLIDAKGPHGFSLHFHAQVGGKEAEPVLDYLQSVKKIEMKPNPFMNRPAASKDAKK